MRNYLAILVLGILCARAWSSSAAQLRQGQAKLEIQGLRKATEGQFPYKGSVINVKWYQDGGVIIHPRAFLTSNYGCTQRITGRFHHVDVGTIKAGKGQRYEKNLDCGKSKFAHPLYNRTTGDYDLCLFIVKDPFVFNEKVQLIDLGSEEDCQVGSQCLVSGWEQEETINDTSTELTYSEAAILDYGTCSSRTKDPLICAEVIGNSLTRGIEEYRDVKALECNNKLCGFASWSSLRDREMLPSAYTKVPAVKEWIEATLKKIDEAPPCHPYYINHIVES